MKTTNVNNKSDYTKIVESFILSDKDILRAKNAKRSS